MAKDLFKLAHDVRIANQNPIVDTPVAQIALALVNPSVPGAASKAVRLDKNGVLQIPGGVQSALPLTGALLTGLNLGAPNVQTGSTYSVLATDCVITANASGTLTLTLGTPAIGTILFVRTVAAQTVVSATSNVKPAAGTTAGTPILAGTAGKWAILQYDGTVWQTLAAN